MGYPKEMVEPASPSFHSYPLERRLQGQIGVPFPSASFRLLTIDATDGFGEFLDPLIANPLSGPIDDSGSANGCFL
jgi:hypothetical protein